MGDWQHEPRCVRARHDDAPSAPCRSFLAGRLGGLYVLLLLPFIDIGLARNVMFDAAPPTWGHYLPAHGAVRVLIDAAFTPGFDEVDGLVLSLLWLLGLWLLAVRVFRGQLHR